MIPMIVQKPMQCNTRAKIESLRVSRRLGKFRGHLALSAIVFAIFVGTYRDLSQECRYSINILCKKVIQREHIRFFGTEKNIVGQILNNFCNKKQTTSHLLGRSWADKPFHIRSYDGRTKETEENECANSGEFGFWKSLHNSSWDLKTMLAVDLY